MALFRWRGTTSTAFNNGTNWIDGAGAAYAAGRYPGSVGATYDDVLYDSALASGANSTAGYDASAGEDLESFRVGSAYNGNIGSAAVRLRFQNRSVGDVNIDGSATSSIFISPVGGTIYNTTIQGGTVVLGENAAGIFDTLHILKGTVTIPIPTRINGEFYIGYVTSQADAVVTIDAGVIVANGLSVAGGVITSDASIPLINLYTGTFEHQTGTIALLRQFGGAFNFNSGIVTDGRIYGGKFDCSKSQFVRTITNAYVYTGGKLDLNDKLGNVAITTAVHIDGGTVVWPAGTDANRV